MNYRNEGPLEEKRWECCLWERSGPVPWRSTLGMQSSGGEQDAGRKIHSVIHVSSERCMQTAWRPWCWTVDPGLSYIQSFRRSWLWTQCWDTLSLSGEAGTQMLATDSKLKQERKYHAGQAKHPAGCVWQLDCPRVISNPGKVSGSTGLYRRSHSIQQV